MTTKISIQFNTDNAAFEGDIALKYEEVERILEDLKTSIAINNSGLVRDINGNTVGQWSWE